MLRIDAFEKLLTGRTIKVCRTLVTNSILIEYSQLVGIVVKTSVAAIVVGSFQGQLPRRFVELGVPQI